MIGILANGDETAAIEEFFQLFKTPWEWYRSGRSYAAVIVSGESVPEAGDHLVVLIGSDPKTADREVRLTGRSRLDAARLEFRGKPLPLYGPVRTFSDAGRILVRSEVSGEAAVLLVENHGLRILRLGYDLFDEIAHLLGVGQPPANAAIPAVDRHIDVLREGLLAAGVSFLEIPPVPAGHGFMACLTHDIDFVGIRRHFFDHTLLGFLWRATMGSVVKMVQGRVSPGHVLRTWRAVASLPLVYLGWARDFWEPFGWYARVEEGIPATYYMIPFKHRCGDKLTQAHASRRASAYDISDVRQEMADLVARGCEVGVHGIDAWHSVQKGREELERVREIAGESKGGIRMHWLMHDAGTFGLLEEAGYSYDSTLGYNDAVGYRNGTLQVFRPPGTRDLLELPMHIQDGALFLEDRLGLTNREATDLCGPLLDDASRYGGVLTLLWHDRSHAPERYWGGFYEALVGRLKSMGAWFGTGAQVVDWFRRRRAIAFERVSSRETRVRLRPGTEGRSVQPPLTVRVTRARLSGAQIEPEDIAWTGETYLEVELGSAAETPAATSSEIQSALRQ